MLQLMEARSSLDIIQANWQGDLDALRVRLGTTEHVWGSKGTGQSATKASSLLGGKRVQCGHGLGEMGVLGPGCSQVDQQKDLPQLRERLGPQADGWCEGSKASGRPGTVLASSRCFPPINPQGSMIADLQSEVQSHMQQELALQAELQSLQFQLHQCRHDADARAAAEEQERSRQVDWGSGGLSVRKDEGQEVWGVRLGASG